MAEHKHWKADFPAEYLGSQHLVDGKDMIVKIKDAGMETVQNQQGKEEKLVIVLDGDMGDKPNKMIINKTNAKRIEKVVGSPYLDDWCGKKIQLYGEMTPAFGDVSLALRVREFAPKGE